MCLTQQAIQISNYGIRSVSNIFLKVFNLVFFFYKVTYNLQQRLNTNTHLVVPFKSFINTRKMAERQLYFYIKWNGHHFTWILISTQKVVILSTQPMSFYYKIMLKMRLYCSAHCRQLFTNHQKYWLPNHGSSRWIVWQLLLYTYLLPIIMDKYKINYYYYISLVNVN